MKRKLLWSAFALVLWGVLLRAQNPGLMTDDSGEIAAAVACLGIGHSPGFPLYMLLGRLASNFLSYGTLAFRLNLMASLFTLLAVLVTVAACRDLWRKFRPEGEGSVAETITLNLLLVTVALSLFSCESVFAQSLTAKGGIYTLALLSVAALIRVSLGESAGPKALGIVFLWSVGMGNHWPFMVFWLMLPAILFNPRVARWSLKPALVAASMGVIGLSPFLYLPLRAARSPVLNWESPSTLESFLSVFLRKSSPAGEMASRSLGEVVRNLREYLIVMGGHWWPGFALLAVVGAWFLFKRRRALILALGAAYGIVVAAIVRVTHFDTLSLYLETNYLSTTQALPAILFFAGALFLAGRHLASRPKVVCAGAAAVALVASLWCAVVFNRQEKSRYTLAEDLGSNLLLELPRGAVVLLDSDVTVMPALYRKIAQGMRPDVAVVPLSLVYSKWGFLQIASEHQTRMSATAVVGGFRDAVRLLMDPTRFASTSVFYAYDVSNLLKAGLEDLAGRLSPWGLSYRLGEGPPGAEESSRFVWAISGRQRVRNLDLAKHLPGTEFTSRVYRANYARPHLGAGSLALGQGFLIPAEGHFRKALSLDPNARGMHLRLASHYKDAGYPEMAEVFCRREIACAPDSAEAHLFHGRLLMERGAMEKAVEAFDRALAIEPSMPSAREARADALQRTLSFAGPPSEPRGRAVDYLALASEYRKAGARLLESAAKEAARDRVNGGNPATEP